MTDTPKPPPPYMNWLDMWVEIGADESWRCVAIPIEGTRPRQFRAADKSEVAKLAAAELAALRADP